MLMGTETKQEKSQQTDKPSVMINVGVGDDKEHVILRFDKHIDWLVMSPVTAIKVAEMMKEKAIEILRSDPTHED
jgi:hypothetical protein